MRMLDLTQGYVALVDDDDFERASRFKWCALVIRRKSDGSVRNIYAKRRLPDKKTQLLHRFLMDAPSRFEVDHKDHDGLNCQRANMRIVTHAQNAHNCRSHKGGASSFLGVTWDKERNKWLAQIKAGNRNRFLGRFETEVEAANAYLKASDVRSYDFA